MRTLMMSLAGGAVVCAGVAAGQDLPFVSGSDGSDGAFTVPISRGIPERWAHSGAYDAARGKTVVYGGWYRTSFPTLTNTASRTDVRLWDGNEWSLQQAAGVNSYPMEAAMGYDRVSQLVILYGGRTPGTPMSNDTQTFDGTTWTQVNATSAPGPLRLMSMAYDEVNDELIMYGGFTGAAASGATWAWDRENNNWINKAPASSPGARYQYAMCWDGAREEIVLFGGYDGTQSRNDTWVWDGTTWSEKSPANPPAPRYGVAMGYDPGSQKVVLYGGWDGINQNDETWTWDGSEWTEEAANRPLGRSSHLMVRDEGRGELLLIGGNTWELGPMGDVWAWDGGNGKWVQKSGDTYFVDLNERADGVYHHTSIDVPAGFTVDFFPNEANTPVTWLAADDVVIDGTVRVNGRTGFARNNNPGVEAAGGPGGGAGGLGGTRVEVYNTVAGTPGQGPGGGTPGINNGNGGGHGVHHGVYGNAYIIPLKGGSGGGGAAASGATDGGNGGGGGGVIAIVSSRDVTVNGTVQANGGYWGRNRSHNGVAGGHGSGGAVKIVGDRILGNGTVEAKAGDGAVTGSRGGYVRLEGYLHPWDIGGTVTAEGYTKSAPVQGVNFTNPPVLVISSVAGDPVPEPPNGNFNNPDVIFAEPGEITVVVTATNIPDGTAVTLRVSTPAGTTTLPAGGDPDVVLAGGTATFTLTVPAGFGTLQAFATYDVDTSNL